ncbi:MAG: protein phosphatase 2C domain-containing protein [Acidimicrobiaceae bacterium]|nr:protein phosphatase 2C domain-containing protein [Acidimicrobiaceae bacterium]
MSAETRSSGATTLAWISDIGPREENQDRAVVRSQRDGSWLIAVADGMGGHPRGREAAEAAIRGLPSRVATPAALFDAFSEANDRVVDLRPDHLAFTLTGLHLCPAATLCVATWTPEGGLLVGHAGDTLAVQLWRDGASWRGRAFGYPHRTRAGSITRFLGARREWSQMTDRDHVHITAETGIDMPPGGYAIVILSDGVWEPLVSEAYTGETLPSDPIAGAVAGCLTPDVSDADSIANQVMTAARTAGLDDNATVAVACRANSA